MKKIAIFLLLLLTPVFVSATIDKNLYYGMWHNTEVQELQQYLTSKGFLDYSATGNFFTLTISAVKKYQASKNIITTGYVGPLTRQAINSDLLSNSNSPETATVQPVPLKGVLSLIKNTSYANQKVVAPQTKFKLSDFSLGNGTTETVDIKKIEVDLAVGSDLYASNLYINNLYVVYGNNTTSFLYTVSHQNYFSANLQLAPGQTVSVEVYGDINSSIPLKSTVKSSVLVTGVTAVSKTSVYTNSNAVLAGQTATFGSGTLSVAADGSTTKAQLVGSGQRVSAGKFKFTSANDSYIISELKFIVPNSAAVYNISDAVLSDTQSNVPLTAKPASIVFNGTDYMFDFNVNIPVAINSSKSVTLYYDLLNAITSYSTNINISPVLVYAKATDSSGNAEDGAASSYRNLTAYYSGITLPSAGITASPLYAFKSVPTFSATSSSAKASNNSNVDVYNFSITADPSGDIGVKQLTFIINVKNANLSNPYMNTNPYLNNFSFFRGSTDITSSVTMGNIIDGNFIGLVGSNAVGIGIKNNIVLTFSIEEKIPAGTTQTYTLKAHANNFIKSTYGADSFSTSMPADTTLLAGPRYLEIITKNVYYGLALTQNNFYTVSNANLIWSDRSSAFPNPHNDFNGYYTNDWYNGYSVPSLPLGAQTVTAQ